MSVIFLLRIFVYFLAARADICIFQTHTEKRNKMKKQKLTWVALIFGLGTTLASCSYKGECTCTVFNTEVTTSYDEDNQKDYNNRKEDCTDGGCDWKAKL